jgi:hypothetical protein
LCLSVPPGQAGAVTHMPRPTAILDSGSPNSAHSSFAVLVGWQPASAQASSAWQVYSGLRIGRVPYEIGPRRGDLATGRLRTSTRRNDVRSLPVVKINPCLRPWSATTAKLRNLTAHRSPRSRKWVVGVRVEWRFSDLPEQVGAAFEARPRQGGRFGGFQHHQSSTLLRPWLGRARLAPFELLWRHRVASLSEVTEQARPTAILDSGSPYGAHRSPRSRAVGATPDGVAS